MQNAFGGVAVASRPARLLQVVFQGTGDIGMDDQAHIFLVDAHAESIGGADDRGQAGDEILLDAFLQRGFEAGVEGIGDITVMLEIGGEILGGLAGGTVDDDTALALVSRPEDVDNRRKLLVMVDRLHLVVQVMPFVAAGKLQETQAKFALDDVDDLGLDVLFGGGGKAL